MRKQLSFILLALFMLPIALFSVTLEQFISREDAALGIPGSRMTVGGDGNVYISSGGYIQRLSPDGIERKGSAIIGATNNVAANINGIMASANAHFNKAVNIWSPDFENVGRVGDFLNNDQVEWFAPADVQAGRTDFYGVDQNRERILRISQDGRMISAHSIEATGESFIRTMPRFRVSEEAQLFYIASGRGNLYALNFDGTLHYKLENAGVGGNIWDGFARALCTDPDGTLYVILNTDNKVYIYDKDANQKDIINLQFGDRSGRISWIEIFNDEIFIKRTDSIVLFEVYDMNTGAFKRSINADVEILNISYDSYVWIADSTVPIKIDLNSGLRKVNPQWKVAIRLFNDSKWIDLPINNGAVKVPSNAGGLYQLKFYGGSDYLLEDFIEIRKPGATLNAAVMSQNNRLYWGQGERIPITVKFRQTEGVPANVLIEMKDEAGTVVVSDTIPVTNGIARTGLTENLLSKLALGRYTITAIANGTTCMEQPIVLGKGTPKRNLFSIVQYGDYSTSMWSYLWTGLPTSTPDVLAQFLERAQYFGFNLYVDRFGHGGSGMLGEFNYSNSVDRYLVGIKSRLEADEKSIPLEKLQVEMPVQQYVGAYSSKGMEEEAILLYMDAGLPYGTSFDSRTDEQYDEAISTVTNALKGYPGFRGWCWAANWWIDKGAALRSLAPEKLAQYNEALKAANETGKWSPILDEVSDIYINWAVDADAFFNSILQREGEGLHNIMTGPYRQPYIIPSITFNNATEIDLQYQSEQVQPPQTAVHNVDFYKRPGKRAISHPEMWNDSGTGDFIYNTLFQVFMRGADGIGLSGDLSGWTNGVKTDVRGTSTGTLSIYRNMFNLLSQYGDWSTELNNNDVIAIPVSTRMMRIEDWSTIGGVYFTNLFEAYNSCMYSHRTAKFVFTEDIGPGVLTQYKAILLVNQTVEWDANISFGLNEARQRNIPIFADESCRPELVRTATALDLSFTHVMNEAHAWQDDGSYLRLPKYFSDNAKILNVAFAVIPQIMKCDNTNIMLSERFNGDGKFIWAVRNDMLDLTQGDMWRMGMTMASHVPQVVDMTLNSNGSAVYDVFAQKELSESVNNSLNIEADFMNMPARLYAVLPAPIKSLVLRANDSSNFGQVYNFGIEIQDISNRIFDVSMPIRYQLLDVDGTVLLEDYTFTPQGRLYQGQITVPLNTKGTSVKLVATELISGKEASIAINLTNKRVLSLLTGDTITAFVNPNSVVNSIETGTFGKIEDNFGAHFKSMVITNDGINAIINSMNYDNNLYSINLETGALNWSKRIGHHYAYDPIALDNGYAIQGMDLNTGEGYHLYLLDNNGNPIRKFATFGFVKRATNWATASNLLDKLNNFTVAKNGSYIAASGDLGLVVWNSAGTELWRQEWWQTERKRLVLHSIDNNRFVALDGMKAICYNAANGQVLWENTFANTGKLEFMVKTENNNTLAFYSNTLGGRIYIVNENGTLINMFETYADMLAISPSGGYIAATNDRQLRYYNVAENIVWSYSSTDKVRNPAFSLDGTKISISDDVGLFTVINAQNGSILLKEDLRGLATSKWLADGSVLVATWNGQFIKYDKEFNKVWSVIPKAPISKNYDAKVVENIPIIKITGVGNATTTNTDLEGNLLKFVKPTISMLYDPQAHADPRPWLNNAAAFFDSDTTPLEKPWIDWTNIQMVDSGWVGRYTFQIDTFNTQLNITGITFYEDPSYIESWLRDVRLEYWDPVDEIWQIGPYMVSDSAVHTHMFDKPIGASKIRLVSTGGGSWPVGNIRLSELVLHGTVGKASHPDVVAERPLAILFDEKDSDLLPGRVMMNYGGRPYVIKYDDGFSGDKSVALTSESSTGAYYYAEYGGHVIPNWLFEIVEYPGPGQYRYLQFAIKALSPDVTQVSVWFPGIQLAFGGNADLLGVGGPRVLDEKVPTEWTTVRADLWMLRGNIDYILNSFSFGSKGGGVAIDQIVLGRTLEDLPAESENGYH